MLADPTIYERLLGVFSKPRAIARYRERLRYNSTIASMQGAVRAYEAVESTRLRKQRIDQRSANQINQVSAESLRFQARNLDENHDLAKSVLNTLVASVVGRGIRTIPMVKDEQGELLSDVNQGIQELWTTWCERPEVTRSLSWNQVQRMMARAWLRDGEVFARNLIGKVVGLRHGTDVSYSLQLLEADYCPVGYTKEADKIRQGIKLDVWGRAEAYKFHKAYPTEVGFGVGTLATVPMGGVIFVDESVLITVPAFHVTHLKFSDRLGALRGVSNFASVFTRLTDLKDYEESERVAARIGAAFALAMTKSVDGDPSTTGTPQWAELDIVPGMVAHDLAPGEKIEVIKNERPSNQLETFRRGNLRAVAGGTRAGYSSISKEYEGSYSSQRQELQEQSVIYNMMRDEFVANCVVPIYRTFVTMIRMQGLIKGLDKFDDNELSMAVHVGPGVPFIDPLKELQADAVAWRSGFKSKSQIILERFGRDPADVRRELQEEMEADKAAGLYVEPDDGASQTGDGEGTKPLANVG